MTKNIIEERIHKIIDDKTKLIEMIGKDDREIIKIFSKEELIAILKKL